MSFDGSILLALQSIRTPFLTGFFTVISEFGSESIQLPLVAFLFWSFDKRSAIRIGINYFLIMYATQILKIAFCIPRPWLRFEGLSSATNYAGEVSGFSFPSGHTSGAVSIYGTMMTTTKKRWIQIAFAVLILLVGFSRLYLGVHTPTDVLTGLLIGVLLVAAANLIGRSAASNPAQKQQIIAFGFAMILFGILYATLKSYPEGTSLKLKIDTMKTLGAAFGGLLGYLIEERFIRFTPPRGWIARILVFIIGMALTFGLRVALKAPLVALFGGFADGFIRYTILTLWIAAAYPALFSTVLRRFERIGEPVHTPEH